jgi:hypothetical protein
MHHTISALSSTIGFVPFSVLMGHGVLSSAYVAVLLAALIGTANDNIALSLRSHFAQTINLIRQRTETIPNNIKSLFSILAVFNMAAGNTGFIYTMGLCSSLYQINSIFRTKYWIDCTITCRCTGVYREHFHCHLFITIHYHGSR